MLKNLWWDDFFLLFGLVRMNIITALSSALIAPSFSPSLCSASSSLAYTLDLGDPSRQVVLTCWTKLR